MAVRRNSFRRQATQQQVSADPPSTDILEHLAQGVESIDLGVAIGAED